MTNEIKKIKIKALQSELGILGILDALEANIRDSVKNKEVPPLDENWFLAAADILAKARSRFQWLKSGNVTKQDLLNIFNTTNGCCFYCKKPILNPKFWPSAPRGFDHVIPKSKGGLHEKSNLVACCFPCNIAKGDKILSGALGEVKSGVS